MVETGKRRGRYKCLQYVCQTEIKSCWTEAGDGDGDGVGDDSPAKKAKINGACICGCVVEPGREKVLYVQDIAVKLMQELLLDRHGNT